MKVLQCLNNNAILVSINEKKAIITGKGIGFNVYKNDVISESKVERMFILKEDITIQNFISIVNKVPLEIIQLAGDIYTSGKEFIGKKLSENLIVTLSDHLQFAIDRINNGMIMCHPLQWEIQQIYPKEYEFGMLAIEMIGKTLNTQIPQQETAFIAMHFINAELEWENLHETAEFTVLMYEVVKIIQYQFQITLNQESLDFSRFVMHLRYFLLRQSKQVETVDIEHSLIEIVRKKYVEETQCVGKINIFLEHNFGWSASENEQLYLTLHVNRLIERLKN